jgi:hypothetical protein
MLVVVNETCACLHKGLVKCAAGTRWTGAERAFVLISTPNLFDALFVPLTFLLFVVVSFFFFAYSCRCLLSPNKYVCDRRS